MFGRMPPLSGRQVEDLISEMDLVKNSKPAIAKKYGMSKTKLYLIYDETNA